MTVINRYKIEKEDKHSIEDVFGDLIEEHGEPAVLLRGLRNKEDMTQVDFAKAIGVTQANLSAMENNRRIIGKDIAKRIGKKFGVDY